MKYKHEGFYASTIENLTLSRKVNIYRFAVSYLTYNSFNNCNPL